MSIQILGAEFNISPKHTEGDILKADEAAALNSQYFRDISSKLKPLVAKAQKADPEGLLSEAAREAIEAQLAEFIKTHNYSPKSSNSYDPVLKEAIKIAKPLVLAAIKKKGVDPKTMSEEHLERVILGALEKRADIMEEARRRVKAVAEFADSLATE